MFKFNNISNRQCSGFFTVNFEFIWHASSVFWVPLSIQMSDRIVYWLNLSLSMCLRVESRGPVTFKMKLSVTTVNNSFQLLPVFCHKDLNLRCCIGLELNIKTWFTKILKGIRGSPMIKCNLRKIKTHSPRCPKKYISWGFSH